MNLLTNLKLTLSAFFTPSRTKKLRRTLKKLRRTLKNKILIALASLAVIGILTGMGMIETGDMNLGTLIAALSIGYLALFCYANNWFEDWL